MSERASESDNKTPRLITSRHLAACTARSSCPTDNAWEACICLPPRGRLLMTNAPRAAPKVTTVRFDTDNMEQTSFAHDPHVAHEAWPAWGKAETCNLHAGVCFCRVDFAINVALSSYLATGTKSRRLSLLQRWPIRANIGGGRGGNSRRRRRS